MPNIGRLGKVDSVLASTPVLFLLILIALVLPLPAESAETSADSPELEWWGDRW